MLSGSWDKTVLDWDLETGKLRTSFAPCASQVSCIESRPISSLPVPAESGEVVTVNGFSSPKKEAGLSNGVHSRAGSNPLVDEGKESPDSLFGGDEGDDDLFGDSALAVMSNGGGLDAFALAAGDAELALRALGDFTLGTDNTGSETGRGRSKTGGASVCGRGGVLGAGCFGGDAPFGGEP